MKNKIFILLLSLFAFSNLSAQAWEGIGGKKLSAGLEFYGYGTGAVLNFDYGVLEDVSIGLGANYAIDINNFYLNARADYHLQRVFQLPSAFDIYIGGDLGYNSNFTSQIRGGIRAGMRYMIVDTVGLYLELGSRGNVGISFNL